MRWSSIIFAGFGIDFILFDLSSKIEAICVVIGANKWGSMQIPYFSLAALG